MKRESLIFHHRLYLYAHILCNIRYIGLRRKFLGSRRGDPRCTCAVQNFNISIYSQVAKKVVAHRLQFNRLWNDLKLIVPESLFSENDEDIVV